MARLYNRHIPEKMVRMQYPIPTQYGLNFDMHLWFDKFCDTLAKHREIRDQVMKQVPNIEYILTTNGEDVLEVGLRGRNDTLLEQALKEYVTRAGMPTIIAAGSDYKLAERVLRPLGKTLRRRFLTYGDGKEVEKIRVTCYN